MNGYLITFCAGVAALLAIVFGKVFLCAMIIALWIGILCVRTCLNFYAIDRSNDDIYDKDFTSLDDVPKPVVKIDEHC